MPPAQPPPAGSLAPGGGHTSSAIDTWMCANASETKIVASTASKISVAHHECEAQPIATVGTLTPSPMVAMGRAGARSEPQSHISMAASEIAPETKAATIQDKVSNRKKPAVPAAATNGDQPSPGSRSKCLICACTGLVTNVSRPPNTVPGSQ